METEWEATFWPIEKDAVRERLQKAGATLVYPERLMRRVNLFPPSDKLHAHAFVRVRDEGDKITMTVKDMSGTKIEEQMEVELIVNDFDKAQELLRELGCKDKNYQETRRELWTLGDTHITIDEWPFLDPFIEIEGAGEAEVRAVSELLGFDWNDALFCSADKLYATQYGVDIGFARSVSRLTFTMESPFKNGG